MRPRAVGRLGSLLATLTLLGCASLWPVRSNGPGRAVDVLGRVAPHVLSLEVSRGGDLFAGSAFLVSGAGLAVTSRHLVRDADSIVVFRDATGGAPARDVVVVAESAAWDLALLQIESEYRGDALPLGRDADIRLGMPIAVLGWADITHPTDGAGGRVSPTVFSGGVSTLGRDATGGLAWVFTDAQVLSGMSGGPVITLDGLVVGVASETFVEQEAEGEDGWAKAREAAPGLVWGSLGMIVPVGRIRALLTAAERPQSKRPPGSDPRRPLEQPES